MLPNNGKISFDPVYTVPVQVLISTVPADPLAFVPCMYGIISFWTSVNASQP